MNEMLNAVQTETVDASFVKIKRSVLICLQHLTFNMIGDLSLLMQPHLTVKTLLSAFHSQNEDQ